MPPKKSTPAASTIMPAVLRAHPTIATAVQSTVKDWKFAPAFRQKPLPGPDPRAPIVHWEQSPVAIYLDFESSFEVVHGKGLVRAR